MTKIKSKKKLRHRTTKLKLPRAASSGPDVHGLHLWAVKHNRHSEDNNFWITTKIDSPIDALKKARAFMKSELYSHNHHIISVVYTGVLDA